MIRRIECQTHLRLALAYIGSLQRDQLLAIYALLINYDRQVFCCARVIINARVADLVAHK